jgi:hypothetical protein
MLRFVPSIAAMVIALVSTQLPAQRRYVSPDNRNVATVVPVGPSRDESRVTVSSRDGSLLCTQDYSSKDGDHGYEVVKAAWTPDSKYFVYSMESSGGHSVMIVPTLFCSTIRHKVFGLSDLLHDNVIFPNFSIKAPDQITVTLQTRKQGKTVSLSRLEYSEK